MKYIVAILLIINARCLADTCSIPRDAAPPAPMAAYLFPHEVSELTDGPVSVNDKLEIWSKNKSSVCFRLETIHDKLHQCWLDGAAKLAKNGLYEYQNGQCRIRFRFEKSIVRLEVEDSLNPQRHVCNPADTEQYVCGTNTGITPAVFKESKE